MSSKAGVKINVSLKKISKIMKERGLDGEVQKKFDNEVIRVMEPYMPRLTGVMINSVPISTTPGSGVVTVDTPYAHRRLLEARNNGLRGPNYFERMKADRLDDLLEFAAKAAGGEAEK